MAYDLESPPPKPPKIADTLASKKDYEPSLLPLDLKQDVRTNKYTLVGVDIGKNNAIGACIYPAGTPESKIYFTKKSKVIQKLTKGIVGANQEASL